MCPSRCQENCRTETHLGRLLLLLNNHGHVLRFPVCQALGWNPGDKLLCAILGMLLNYLVPQFPHL